MAFLAVNPFISSYSRTTSGFIFKAAKNNRADTKLVRKYDVREFEQCVCRRVSRAIESLAQTDSAF
jgi:hypothetical protein